MQDDGENALHDVLAEAALMQMKSSLRLLSALVEGSLCGLDVSDVSIKPGIVQSLHRSVEATANLAARLDQRRSDAGRSPSIELEPWWLGLRALVSVLAAFEIRARSERWDVRPSERDAFRAESQVLARQIRELEVTLTLPPAASSLRLDELMGHDPTRFWR